MNSVYIEISSGKSSVGGQRVMSVLDFIEVVGYSVAIFSAGVQVGKYISEHKNNRPTSQK